MTVSFAIVISIVFGLLIEGFFQLIRYKNELDKLNSSMPEYVSINYMPVNEFLSCGNRKWVNYFLFRTIPPFIILILLASIFQRYFHVNNSIVYLLFAAAVSAAVRDIKCIFSAKLISEKILHVINILLVLFVALIVWVISLAVNIGLLAPTLSGVMDNIWASLFVAMLILFYIKITDMNTKKKDDKKENGDILTSYIIKSGNNISNKFDKTIKDVCHKNSCSVRLLYAVLIYEDMNRPPFLRLFENLIVKLTHLRLTVGIAQVKSNKPLTDIDSIICAGKILEKTKYIDNTRNVDSYNLSRALAVYNNDRNYIESVSKILSELVL